VFRSVAGRLRVRVNLPDDIPAKYGGGFIGLLRPDLHERMLAPVPTGVLRVNRDVQRIEQDQANVWLHMADGEVITADVLVGADGIDSLVRRTLWATHQSVSTTCTSSGDSPSTGVPPEVPLGSGGPP
jgi:2-polyprenyl-6-methoxyphenol hydroxylase-like FAD-dependent oxidoreductase